jgi:hypothetical protein
VLRIDLVRGVIGAVRDRIAVDERPSCMAVSPSTGWLYVADYAGVLTGLPVLRAVDTDVAAEPAAGIKNP